MGDKTIVILTRDTDPKTIADARSKVELAGFRLETEIPELGTLVGKIDAGLIDQLEKIDELLSVTEEESVNLPPGEGQR